MTSATMNFRTLLVVGICITMPGVRLFGQDPEALVQEYLEKNREELGLTEGDITHWRLTDRTTSRTSGTTFLYFQQTAHGRPVHNAVGQVAIKDGRVVHASCRFITDILGKVSSAPPILDATAAVRAAIASLGLGGDGGISASGAPTNGMHILFAPGIARGPIRAEPIFQPLPDGRVLPAWDLTIHPLKGHHWWHMAVDAMTGEVLRKNDYTVECSFPQVSSGAREMAALRCEAPDHAPAPPAPDGYRVYATPVESPSHGDRTLVSDPYDTQASPFGWHDTDGEPGAEYTITRGNNVLASEDFDDNDQPGYSPDGGASLEFDFPIDFDQNPSGYLDASITNLFYWNNLLHDVWYHYGFDPESGAFQVNNYGEGGSGGDPVIADAQDGGGMNNANFATPPDGESGRMQMYNWSDAAGENELIINSPPVIAGAYIAPEAGFGPGIPGQALTADVVAVLDDTAPTGDGCEQLTNAADLAGKIALVDRGLCTFVVKVQAAQDAGALAVIVVNNVAGDPFQMGGSTGNITIPAVMVSQADGQAIRDQLADGPVNATFQTPVIERDGCLDNGVIAHEYGHGISNRLTGGPSNSDCLFNAEQMGEGWSDWVGLMMTIEPGDQGSDGRGIGTFADGQAVTGVGIRPARYSTDLSVNGFTYGATNSENSLSEPHGIGFVWCTMLWDMTWSLIDAYGLDPDLFNGDGGNNVAMRLVIEGLKLQPCSPGFVDGRDAILAADSLLYDGANHCRIWQAFARRGLGFSAQQGSTDSRTDQVEAFDLPPECLGVGLQEQVPGTGYSVHPNPTADEMIITLGKPLTENGSAVLFDAGGRKLWSAILQRGIPRTTIDLSPFAPGLYFLEVGTSMSMERQRVVIAR